MAVKPVIQLANLTKHFGDTRAVHDVTLSIGPGEIVGFVGPNGAGKTTTIAMLLGFIRPTKGRAFILGKEILPEKAHTSHRQIGYVAGDMTLPGGLTGKQYLDFSAHQCGRNSSMYENLVADIVPVLNKRIRTLSRGNKQKLALIAALQHQPKVLILDEPTSGLDPLMQDVFLSAIQRAARSGATVFMSSHILSEVVNICERVVFMKRGRIVVDKPINEIEKQAGKVVTIEFSSKPPSDLTLPRGARVLEKSPLSFRYDGDIKPLLRWLSNQPCSDVRIIDRELDDIFRELYIESEGES